MYKKFTVSVLIALTLLLTFGISVLAIDSPDSYSLYEPAYIFRNVSVAGDTLVVGKYNITYSPLPDEYVHQAYIFRFLDSLGEPVGSATTYPAVTKGYGEGAYSIYIESGIAWEGTYSVQIIGNPTLEWTAGIPEKTITGFTWDTSSDGLANYVMTLAGELQVAWDTTLTSTTTTGGTVLNSTGITYFVNVIPGLRAMAPNVFSVTESLPEFKVDEPDRSFEEGLLGIWDVTTYGGYFANLAGWIEAEAATLKLIIFGVVFAVTLVVVMMQVPQAWNAPILTAPVLYFGNCGGLLPIGVTILVGFGFFFLLVFAFFYKRSSA